MDPSKIQEVLQSLGYKLSDRGSYWQTNAIFRNGDNKTALQIYKDTGVWKDYVEGTSFFPFKRLIEATLGTNDKKEVSKYIDQEDASLLYTKKTAQAPKLEMEEVYGDIMLERLLPHYKFYNNKGISTRTLKALKGGLATSGQLNQRFVFPIVNDLGQIHGFSGRDMKSREGSNRPKWKHIGKKKNWIYPLYLDKRTEAQIAKDNYVIIVESIGDLLNLKENGFHNVLVSFGLDISSKLTCALVSLAPEQVIISFNNDSSQQENRGLDASFKNYLKLLGVLAPEKIKICLPTKNDFGDMNKEDFADWKRKVLNKIKTDQSEEVKLGCREMAKRKKLPKKLAQRIALLDK
jgi:hypothetical protein